MTSDELLSRIHDLEAVVNGLMIYIAAKEAGVDLDINDESVGTFLRTNVIRPIDVRKSMCEGSTPIAADGYHDGAAMERIPVLAEKIRNQFKS